MLFNSENLLCTKSCKSSWVAILYILYSIIFVCTIPDPVSWAESITLSGLWTTYVVQRTEIFQKFAVQAVLAHCRYQHMRIELLFHMVFSTSCFEVHFVQYCRKKSDRLMMASRSL